MTRKSPTYRNLICEVCKSKGINYESKMLENHLVKVHGMNKIKVIEYYNSYIKTESEDICIGYENNICTNKLTFYSINQGYPCNRCSSCRSKNTSINQWNRPTEMNKASLDALSNLHNDYIQICKRAKGQSLSSLCEERILYLMKLTNNRLKVGSVEFHGGSYRVSKRSNQIEGFISIEKMYVGKSCDIINLEYCIKINNRNNLIGDRTIKYWSEIFNFDIILGTIKEIDELNFIEYKD